MNDERRTRRRSESSGRRRNERTSEVGTDTTWRDLDGTLEVRSRLVLIADSIECGDIRTAELCVFQLLDDLDSAEELLSSAKRAA
jgi:hypothetical protein